MGRLLIFISLILPLSVACASSMDGLAKESGIAESKVVAFVKSGLNEYQDDEIILACLKKSTDDERTAVYAMFNYIMYKDTQSQSVSAKSRKEVYKHMKINRFAKKSIEYCMS